MLRCMHLSGQSDLPAMSFLQHELNSSCGQLWFAGADFAAASSNRQCHYSMLVWRSHAYVGVVQANRGRAD